MSGNKSIVAIVALLLILQACFIFKEKPDKPERPDKPDKPDTTEVGVDTMEVDTIQIGLPKKKDRYQIAILLPFSLDDEFLFNYDFGNHGAQYRPLIATELYEGMKLALRELDSLGAPFTVNVYDTRNSEEVLRKILRKREVQQADLIFGPLFPDRLKLASEMLDSTFIGIVSPYAGKLMLDSADSRMFQVKPSLDAHMERIARYIFDRYPAKTILLMHPPDSSDRDMALAWEEKFRELNPRFSELLPVKRLEVRYSGLLDSNRLRLGDSTVVLVASYNEIFLNNLMRELNKQREDRPVLLFGLPNLLDRLNTIRFDYLNSLHFHTSQSHYQDTTSTAYDTVRNRHFKHYGFPPQENALIGYNQMLYFGYLLYEMGPSYTDLLGIGNLAPITETFDFQPVYEETPDPFNPRVVHHYENRYVSILRYKNYELLPVRTGP